MNEGFYRVRNLSFAYPGTRRGARQSHAHGGALLQDASFDLHRGETSALVGANGSGKTTLGRLLMGMLVPDAGTIELDGRPLAELKLHQVGRAVGYLFQHPGRQLFGSTVFEDLAFPLRLQGENEEALAARIEAVLARLDLGPHAHKAPYALSMGEQQRLAIASILLNRSRFMILDEPTTALDTRRKDVLATLLGDLQNEGVGILIIGHDRRFLDSVAQRVLRLEDGEVRDAAL